jgi:AcrR family transcriptional regulator
MRRGDELATRAVARESGIAHGTLFNYFPTKEALAQAVCVRELELAAGEVHAGETLEEQLFALTMAGLRRLRPYRAHVAGLFHEAPDAHVVAARALIVAERGELPTLPVALHLYGALYLGVLSWWAADTSAKQEETLAVLDRALNMFVASLGDSP